MRLIFSRSACSRKSGPLSTKTHTSGVSIKMEARVRVSSGSDDVQILQSQPITGTPTEVLVPRNVSENSFFKLA